MCPSRASRHGARPLPHRRPTTSSATASTTKSSAPTTSQPRPNPRPPRVRRQPRQSTRDRRVDPDRPQRARLRATTSTSTTTHRTSTTDACRRQRSTTSDLTTTTSVADSSGAGPAGRGAALAPRRSGCLRRWPLRLTTPSRDRPGDDLQRRATRSASARLNGSGQATITADTSELHVGSVNLRVAYSGDDYFAPVSVTLPLTVDPAASSSGLSEVSDTSGTWRGHDTTSCSGDAGQYRFCHRQPGWPVGRCYWPTARSILFGSRRRSRHATDSGSVAPERVRCPLRR